MYVEKYMQLFSCRGIYIPEKQLVFLTSVSRNFTCAVNVAIIVSFNFSYSCYVRLCILYSHLEFIHFVPELVGICVEEYLLYHLDYLHDVFRFSLLAVLDRHCDHSSCLRWTAYFELEFPRVFAECLALWYSFFSFSRSFGVI
jgi:uncharacterized membrane protein YesL